MNSRSLAVAAVLALLVPSMAFARVQNVPRQPSVKPQGFQAEALANLDDVEEKILELAQSMPAERYSWRPSKDVRSVSEVYMHIAGSNYFLCSFLGIDAPKVNGDAEKMVTKKAEVIAELKRSFDHLRNAIATTNDLEKPVTMFGEQTTRRGVLLTIISHLHEHLGQSIAYARMNGVVPPWSR